MSEAEFDRLLEAVRMAIEPAPQEEDLADCAAGDARRAAESRQRQSVGLAAYSVSRRLVRRLLRAVARNLCGLTNNQCKALIILMEATTRIELVYTVLQTVA